MVIDFITAYCKRILKMLRVLRSRGIMQIFSCQQRFCRVESDVMNEKEIEIKKKTPRGKLDHELEMENEEKPYEDPYLPKHPGGIYSNFLNRRGLASIGFSSWDICKLF